MKVILKTIFAAIIGIIISLCVYELVDALNGKLYPSTRMQPTYQERVNDIQALPLQAYLLLLGGYIVSSFMGGYTAARLAPFDRKILAAFSVGFFLLLAGIVYFLALPHPIWLVIGSCLSFLIFSYAGAIVAKGKAKAE